MTSPTTKTPTINKAKEMQSWSARYTLVNCCVSLWRIAGGAAIETNQHSCEDAFVSTAHRAHLLCRSSQLTIVMSVKHVKPSRPVAHRLCMHLRNMTSVASVNAEGAGLNGGKKRGLPIST